MILVMLLLAAAWLSLSVGMALALGRLLEEDQRQ